MENTIGVKLANGEYYPVIQENSRFARRLVLTGARDGQSRLQIDLYRAPASVSEPSAYIGRVVVDNLNPAARGGASVELILGYESPSVLAVRSRDLARPESAQIARFSLPPEAEAAQNTRIAETAQNPENAGSPETAHSPENAQSPENAGSGPEANPDYLYSADFAKKEEEALNPPPPPPKRKTSLRLLLTILASVLVIGAILSFALVFAGSDESTLTGKISDVGNRILGFFQKISK